MTNLENEYDSDSAPEDIAFKDAKSEAIEHIKSVSKAVKEKKKLRKEVNKRRLEALTEQKEQKLSKLKDLESKKLSHDILDALDDPGPLHKKAKINVNIKENSKITFDEESFEDTNLKKQSDDFIALETSATDFKVVTNRDLNSSKFKSSEAFNFKQKMLFGNRIKREPFRNQALRKEKISKGGKCGKI